LLEHQRRVEHEERVSDVLRLRWLSLFGAVAWLAFGLQDWMVANHVHVKLEHFWGLRGIGLVPILLVIARLHSSRMPSRAELTFLDLGVFSLLQGAIALMCVEYGGLSSRYISGTMVILIARSSVLAAPLRRGLLLIGVPLLMYPGVLVGSAAFRPDIALQFSNPEEVSIFIQGLFVLAVSAGLCVWGGHGNWALRRQLFETRNIGKYRLKRCIGRGGMGEVWIAHHAGLRRDVALKILRPDQDADPVAVQRFEREVDATSRLTHPNTVKVFDYGVTEDGIWYYAMELLEGRTLYDLVSRDGPLPVPRALHILYQAARALAEAHSRGIVHRDIKPENLYITSAGDEPDFVKVLDFGIAKMCHDITEVHLTRTGAIFGTPAYMSPEAARGEAVDARSDVYGLGAVLYYAISGQAAGGEPIGGQTLLAQAHRPVRPLSSFEKLHVPASVDALVMRCLEKDPALRFADAVELASALAPLRVRESSRAASS
jgi:serine/threonine-protein kinase